MKENLKAFFLHTLRALAGAFVLLVVALAAVYVAGIVAKVLWSVLLSGFNLIG